MLKTDDLQCPLVALVALTALAFASALGALVYQSIEGMIGLPYMNMYGSLYCQGLPRTVIETNAIFYSSAFKMSFAYKIYSITFLCMIFGVCFILAMVIILSVSLYKFKNKPKDEKYLENNNLTEVQMLPVDGQQQVVELQNQNETQKKVSPIPEPVSAELTDPNRKHSINSENQQIHAAGETPGEALALQQTLNVAANNQEQLNQNKQNVQNKSHQSQVRQLQNQENQVENQNLIPQPYVPPPPRNYDQSISKVKIIAGSLLYSLALLMVITHFGLVFNMTVSVFICTSILLITFLIVGGLSLLCLILLIACFVLWQVLRHRMHKNMENEQQIKRMNRLYLNENQMNLQKTYESENEMANAANIQKNLETSHILAKEQYGYVYEKESASDSNSQTKNQNQNFYNKEQHKTVNKNEESSKKTNKQEGKKVTIEENGLETEEEKKKRNTPKFNDLNQTGNNNIDKEEKEAEIIPHFGKGFKQSQKVEQENQEARQSITKRKQSIVGIDMTNSQNDSPSPSHQKQDENYLQWLERSKTKQEKMSKSVFQANPEFSHYKSPIQKYEQPNQQARQAKNITDLLVGLIKSTKIGQNDKKMSEEERVVNQSGNFDIKRKQSYLDKQADLNGSQIGYRLGDSQSKRQTELKDNDKNKGKKIKKKGIIADYIRGKYID